MPVRVASNKESETWTEMACAPLVSVTWIIDSFCDEWRRGDGSTVTSVNADCRMVSSTPHRSFEGVLGSDLLAREDGTLWDQRSWKGRYEVLPIPEK